MRRLLGLRRRARRLRALSCMSREKVVHIGAARSQAGQMLHPERSEAEPKNAFVVIQLG
jgi:hypothetical protein